MQTIEDNICATNGRATWSSSTATISLQMTLPFIIAVVGAKIFWRFIFLESVALQGRGSNTKTLQQRIEKI